MNEEIPWVTSVHVVGPYILQVTFRDGCSRTVDMEPTVRRGRIFEPLKDPEYFAKAFVDFGTVAWPGDIDIAPEFLYERVRVRA